MENLETMIQLLYKRVSVKKIIMGEIKYSPFDRTEFLRMARSYIFHYSENEAVNLLNYFLDVFFMAAPQVGRQISNELNVFEPLFYYSGKFLTIRDNEIVCRYRFLLEWRRMTTALSEDLFITAYYAQKTASLSEMTDTGFSWKRVIGHDNAELNAIMKRGISENHCHLNGAAPIFQISWLSLMNNVKMSRFAAYLKSYDQNRRYTNVAYEGSYEEEPLYQKYMQAVLIRLLLYSILTEKRLKIGNYDITFEEVQRFLKIPPIHLNQYEGELCIKQNILRELEQMFVAERQDIYTFRDLVTQILTIYLKEEGEGEEKLGEVWGMNPQLADILRGGVGDYFLDVHRIGRIVRYSEGVPLSKLLVKLLSVKDRVLLEDVRTIFYDENKFLSIWNRRTLENVKRLLLNPQDIESGKEKIQAMIDAMRFENWEEGNKEKKIDYALNGIEYMGKNHEKKSYIYAGERWMMCMMFRKIYMNQKNYSEYFNLFYVYLLIKESIRSELVQSNDNVGFHNFQVYQNRKSNLLADEIYRNEFTRHAVADSLYSGNMLNLEVRIGPEVKAKRYNQNIQHLDKLLVIGDKWKKHLFYVIHFIKEDDEKVSGTGYTYCRHNLKRKSLEKEAFALAELRERYPLVGERILGIDAASGEIGCRPEVFAPIFRYLKNHKYSYYTVEGKKKLPQLNVTYHVGEDFLDLADGLRAIEEAVLFLNLESGDRLGHALALGVDVEEWYQKKRYRIALCVQDHLDNLVWIYCKLFQYDIKGFENLKEWIRSKYSELFEKLYYANFSQGEVNAIIGRYPYRSSSMLDMGIFNYYRAWELRGDDPELYEMGYFDKHRYLEKWEEFRVNFQYPQDFSLRWIAEIALINYMYHYNKDIRESGAKTIEVHVPQNYAGAVAEIQKAMQKDIAKRGIAIETNPSSNFLIGTFRQYDKHPILRFYNKGLGYDTRQIQECPQLSVSINTDDKGVFSTSLENEYALIACALEFGDGEKGSELYKRSDIYEWLDRVRIMGNEQSFANKYVDCGCGDDKESTKFRVDKNEVYS